MNTIEGMSDEELDAWADIFYQAKVSGVTEAIFSQFISNPFVHLGPAFHRRDSPDKEAQHLRLAYSRGTSSKPRPPKWAELATLTPELSG